MILVPVNTPVNIPVLPIVATVGLLLLQVPPAMVLANVAVPNGHTLADAPVHPIAAVTVTDLVAIRHGLIKEMVTTPADTPVAIPVALIVMIDGLLVDHVPPDSIV
jgi:hypothetical protein